MKIIGGPSSQLLSKRVSDLLGVELVPVEYKVFPDGEKYCRISAPIEGEEVMIIQSTPSDSDIIYLMELIDACEIARKRRWSFHTLDIRGKIRYLIWGSL
jgi:Phosphoribosylpyrophosphate synthetase